MLQIECHRDEYGVFRAIVSPPLEVIGWYLEQDVQGSVWACDDLLEKCKMVKSGEKSEWSGTGNAHTATVRVDQVLIENEFADSEVTCSLDDFMAALQAWKACIIQHKGSDELG